MRRTDFSTSRPREGRKKEKRGMEDEKVKGGEEIRINRKFSLKAEARREEKRGGANGVVVWFGLVRRKRQNLFSRGERRRLAGWTN